MRVDFIAVVFWMVWLGGVSVAHAAEDKAANKDQGAVKVEQAKTQGTLKQLIDRMWGRLRGLSPDNANAQATTGAQVAGVRGAESTDSLVKPYWKDDRSKDKAFRAEIQSYQEAVTLARGKDGDKAAAALNDFLARYPKSALRPNVYFALALMMSESDRPQATTMLERLIREYPDHPLAKEAQALTRALTKS